MPRITNNLSPEIRSDITIDDWRHLLHLLSLNVLILGTQSVRTITKVFLELIISFLYMVFIPFEIQVEIVIVYSKKLSNTDNLKTIDYGLP